jgi:GNAT superfamily N-acetyltransferase
LRLVEALAGDIGQEPREPAFGRQLATLDARDAGARRFGLSNSCNFRHPAQASMPEKARPHRQAQAVAGPGWLMSVGGPERPVGGLAVRAPAGVELRPAGRDDLPAVLRLLAERAGAPMPAEPGAAQATWEAHLSSVDAAPFLALGDDEPAGLLLLAFRRRLNFATWEGWIPELVVAATFRGRGIGRALLRVGIEEWRLRRAHRLSVDAWQDEEVARTLLSGMGFDESMLRFRLAPLQGKGLAVPDGLEIRRLSAADFEPATRLVAEMGPHCSPVPDRMDAVQRAFRELVRRPSDGSLIAVDGDAPVGICTVEVRATLRDSAPQAWIPELLVTEPMRGRGIGAALLDAALTWASDAGADSAVLESGRNREAAQALYRAAGFEPAGSVFTLLRDG